MKVKYGQQRRLAETVGVSPQVLNDYLAGRCNASPRQARRLGEVTATDPFIWLLPDNLDARPAAVAAWAAEKIEGTDYKGNAGSGASAENPEGIQLGVMLAT